ncbi:MAG: hypothetical protein ACP5OA_00550 [Candidatus Woesearchaeota archaeon]
MDNPLGILKNNIGSAINRATVGTWHRAGIGISRSIGGGLGNLGGSFRFSRLQNVVQSFYARQVLDGEITRSQLKIMSKSAKRLQSFNAKDLAKIFDTYSSNPRKLEEVIRDITTIYIKDISAFNTAFANFLDAIHDSVNRLNDLDDALIDNVSGFLEEAADMAEKGKFNMPPDSIDNIKTEIRTMINEQMFKYNDYENKETTEIDAIKHNKAGSVIKTSLGISWISFKAKRTIDKISKDQLQVILADVADLRRQVSSGNLEITFIPKLKEYLANVDLCEILAKEFRRDIQLLFNTTEADYLLVRESVGEFVTFLGNEEGVSSLKNQITNIEKIMGLIKSELVNEIKDVETLKEHLKAFQAEAPALLDKIKAISQAKIASLKTESGVNQVLNEFVTNK